MAELTPEEHERIAAILMPHAVKQQRQAEKAGQRFVYYTSAAVAIEIIRKREFWMRHAASMNDYLEIEYGLRSIASAFTTERGRRLRVALDQVYPGTGDALLAMLDAGVPHFRAGTYITCVSEHLSSEDRHGRLSMWRAYGGRTPVAIVLNGKAFFNKSNLLKAYTSPVTYWDAQRFEEEMETVAENIEGHIELLRRMGESLFRLAMFNVCKFGVLCAKHPGFREELEWRVVYSPTIEQSDVLIKEIVVNDSTPQTIYKIPLKDAPEAGFVGAEIPQLIDRIIVGPTRFPGLAAEAIVSELADAGVEDALHKVVVSDIPLRV